MARAIEVLMFSLVFALAVAATHRLSKLNYLTDYGRAVNSYRQTD